MISNLTIILVTFCSEKIIKQTLKTLSNFGCSVIVVDNASQDNTVNIIKNDFPNINLIVLSHNIGYGRANNIALNQITLYFLQ